MILPESLPKSANPPGPPTAFSDQDTIGDACSTLSGPTVVNVPVTHSSEPLEEFLRDSYKFALKISLLLQCLKFLFTATAIALAMYFSLRRSPRFPDLTEWEACDKPLGLLTAIRTGVYIVRLLKQSVFILTLVIDIIRIRNGTLTAKSDPERGTNKLRDEGRKLLKWAFYIFECVWFIVVCVYLYMPPHSCKLAAPHLWWYDWSVTLGLFAIILGCCCIILALQLFAYYFDSRSLQRLADSMQSIITLSIKSG